VPAAILAGLAQANHAPVIMPIAGLLAAGWFIAKPEDRRRLVTVYAISVVMAVPSAWVAISGPTVQGSGLAGLVGQFLGTVALRLLVFAVPIGIALWPLKTPKAAWLALAAAIVANVVVVPIRSDRYAWGSLSREPDTVVRQFTRTPGFQPGLTYRILRVGDGKVGMDQLLRAGARLDSEFFPESIDRRSFSDANEYAAFLRERDVDVVLLFDNYTPRYNTNEAALLERLLAQGCAGEPFAGDGYHVYSIALTDACLAGERR
jgi:hypothetical protein